MVLSPDLWVMKSGNVKGREKLVVDAHFLQMAQQQKEPNNKEDEKKKRGKMVKK